MRDQVLRARETLVHPLHSHPQLADCWWFSPPFLSRDIAHFSPIRPQYRNLGARPFLPCNLRWEKTGCGWTWCLEGEQVTTCSVDCVAQDSGAQEQSQSSSRPQWPTLSSNRSAQHGAQAIIWDILPCTLGEANDSTQTTEVSLKHTVHLGSQTRGPQTTERVLSATPRWKPYIVRNDVEGKITQLSPSAES